VVLVVVLAHKFNSLQHFLPDILGELSNSKYVLQKNLVKYSK